MQIAECVLGLVAPSLKFAGIMLAANATLGIAIAEPIGNQMTCMTVSAIMDSPQLSKRDAESVAKYVEAALMMIDLAHVANGEPSILVRISEHGRSNMVAAVASRCREHPGETLLDSVMAVYDGLKKQPEPE